LVMPPSLVDWLAENHVVWTILGRWMRWTSAGLRRRIGGGRRVAARMTRR